MGAAVATRGFYVRMDSQVRCDCGRPATHQVQVTQLKLAQRRRLVEFVQVMPLCEECYREFLTIEGDAVFNTT